MINNSLLSYDSIHLSTEDSTISIEKLQDHLRNFQSHYNKTTDNFYYTGSLKNLKITINNERISIKGSISKFINNNNVKPLSLDDLKRFIETIVLIFRVDPSKWAIKKLDLGVNLILTHSVETYLPLIGGAKYKIFGQFGDSVYLNSGGKKIVFYDKIKEIKKDSYSVVPIEYTYKNIMRMEFRILKTISKFLEISYEPTLESLLSSEFIEACHIYCKTEFDSIRFLHVGVDLIKIKSPKELEHFLMFKGVEYLGMAEVERIVRVLRKANAFKHKPYYSRFMSGLKRKMNRYSKEYPNPLIEEINLKVVRNFLT